ncbi:hypothetical protein DACRYDRAFT_110170 [Dacryopinax primogenitus]|uniref:Uncharacterized protein n=1 Tax=Dacryopinax primogenitus (strain DJM 731) TaxID=1858805 RepID=M5FTM4_DACPD|nr:uncharacterized protein DACRYDRAFT_110170 [Dacryopinax primogenitus]EJT99448.1 hypothetical protein DACRYDRAFT_110170 [Dacryopinax primogenitus]
MVREPQTFQHVIDAAATHGKISPRPSSAQRYDGIHENKERAELRAYFRVTLHRINPALFKAYWVGVEMRAIRLALAAPYPSNTEIWLENYSKFTSTAAREGKWWRVNNLEVMTPKELEGWGAQEWKTVQRELLEERYGQTTAEHTA